MPGYGWQAYCPLFERYDTISAPIRGNEMAERTVVEAKTQSDMADERNTSVRLSPNAPAYHNGAWTSVAREKPKFKNIPEDWKAIPAERFRKVIEDIETVLLQISVDGQIPSNPFDWKPTIPTLHAWANHLRSALKELTK
jgi:hypothetical protein